MGFSSVQSAAELQGVRAIWAAFFRGEGAEGLETGAARRYLLVLRFALLNVTIAAFATAAWSLGWLEAMFATDSYHIVKLICVVFVVGLQQCGSRIFQLSSDLNGLAADEWTPGSRAFEYLRSLRGAGEQSHGILAANLKLKLATRLSHIRYLANLLVLLGLIGTVVGFIVALSGIKPSAAGNVQAIGPMVSGLLEGMAIALYTTLAGSILNIWLMLNYRMLEHGTVQFYTQVVERGEQR
jgi:biopolymer transport protein ExbB/TolQ